MAKPAVKTSKDWPELEEYLVDNKSNRGYRRGPFIGEGGFAKCYEVKEMTSDAIYCCKAIWKKVIKNENEKSKIRSEIRINGSLKHPNIVTLHTCFEDDHFVYIILELCTEKSMMELIKRRKTLTEEEVRYYMVQIIDAMEYCLARRVIHRDLKLGNIFITKDMKLKIGDFGLATQLSSNEDRKKTICGTPNYIAPEVLFDKEGHSFSADMWSIGIIIYTLIIGIPPFQTNSTKKLYAKIKISDFSFPEGKPITEEAKDLITKILTTNPDERPKFHDLKCHPWFTKYYTPDRLDPSALRHRPTFGASGEVMVANPAKSELVDLVSPPKSKITDATPAAIIEDHPYYVKDNDGNFVKPAKVNPSRNGIPQRRPVPPQFMASVNAEVKLNQRENLVAGKSEHLPPSKLPKMSPETVIFQDMVHTIETVCHLSNNQLNMADIINTSNSLDSNPPNFISKWVDHGDQYGLGFELVDGTTGIFFKDSTTMVLAPDGVNLEYLSYTTTPDSLSTKIECQFHMLNQLPSNLGMKQKIFNQYTTYMKDRLSSAILPQAKHKVMGHLQPSYDITAKDRGVSALPYITKFLRTRKATLFRLSNKVVQINFKEDHSKLILHHAGLMVHVIQPDGTIDSHKLVDIINHHYQKKRQNCQPTPPHSNPTDPIQKYHSTPQDPNQPDLQKRIGLDQIYDHISYLKGVMVHVLNRKAKASQK